MRRGTNGAGYLDGRPSLRQRLKEPVRVLQEVHAAIGDVSGKSGRRRVADAARVTEFHVGSLSRRQLDLHPVGIGHAAPCGVGPVDPQSIDPQPCIRDEFDLGRCILLAKSVVDLRGQGLRLRPELGVALHGLQPRLPGSRQVPAKDAVTLEHVRLMCINPGRDCYYDQGSRRQDAATASSVPSKPEGRNPGVRRSQNPIRTAPVTRHNQSRRL